MNVDKTYHNMNNNEVCVYKTGMKEIAGNRSPTRVMYTTRRGGGCVGVRGGGGENGKVFFLFFF